METIEKEKPANGNGEHSNRHTPNVSEVRSKSQWEYQQEFENAIRQAGIDLTDKIIADGKIHRFKPSGKGNPDAWYCFHGFAGAFGDWKQGIKEKWGTRNPSLTPKQREQMQEQAEKARKSLQEEIRRKNQEASEMALRDWNSFSEEGQSPYLTRKKVNAVGVRFGDGFMAMPIKDSEGKLWSYQKIYPNGKKYLLEGGRKKGCFHTLGILEDQKPIYVTEGYATGASVYMATNITTVVAIDAGNLEPVVAALKKKYSKSNITLMGDDDRHKEENTGKIEAHKVTQKHNCTDLFPIFKDYHLKEQPTDWNDLFILEGLEEVKKQIEEGVVAISRYNVTNASESLTEQDFEIVTSHDNVTNLQSNQFFKKEEKCFKTTLILANNLSIDARNKLAVWYPHYAVVGFCDSKIVDSIPAFVKEALILFDEGDQKHHDKARKMKRSLHNKGIVASSCGLSLNVLLDSGQTLTIKETIDQAISEFELPSILSRWTKASDLFKYHTKETEFLVDHLLPAIGVSILGGHPKTGKSWMVLNFIRSILKEEEALSVFSTQKVSVLYFALEDNASRLKSRLQAVFGDDTACLDKLVIKTVSDQLNDKTLEKLRKTLEKNPDIKFVIIDPLQKVRASPEKSHDAYQKDYKDMSMIKQLAEECEVSILLVHHLKKDKMSNDSDISSLNGSMGLAGSADSILLLTKDKTITLKVTGKDIEDRKLLLVFDQETGLFSIDDEEKKINQTLQDQIINWLQFKNKPCTLKEIYAGLEKNDSSSQTSVRNQLGVLRKKKRIECPKRSFYQLLHTGFVTSHRNVTNGVTTGNSHEIKGFRPVCNVVTSDTTPLVEMEEMIL